MKLWKVKEKLYLGDQIQNYMDAAQFDIVVDMAGFDMYLPEEGKLSLSWRIEDGPLPDVPTLIRFARFAYDEWKAGKNLLVHCEAGINRSNLFVAQMLAFDGMKGPDIIQFLRAVKTQSVSLINPQFAEYVKKLNGKPNVEN